LFKLTTSWTSFKLVLYYNFFIYQGATTPKFLFLTNPHKLSKLVVYIEDFEYADFFYSIIPRMNRFFYILRSSSRLCTFLCCECMFLYSHMHISSVFHCYMLFSSARDRRAVSRFTAVSSPLQQCQIFTQRRSTWYSCSIEIYKYLQYSMTIASSDTSSSLLQPLNPMTRQEETYDSDMWYNMNPVHLFSARCCNFPSYFILGQSIIISSY
jgi:hypothetical protein